LKAEWAEKARKDKQEKKKKKKQEYESKKDGVVPHVLDCLQYTVPTAAYCDTLQRTFLRCIALQDAVLLCNIL